MPTVTSSVAASSNPNWLLHLCTLLLLFASIIPLLLTGFRLKTEDCCTLNSLRLKHYLVVLSQQMQLPMMAVMMHAILITAVHLSHSLTVSAMLATSG